MEYLQAWWNMDIKWHHYKHYQMPNLTFLCWRARRDDRIGHLVHPIRSLDAKVMQITSLGLVLCRGCSPAGPTPFPNTSFLATRPLGTLQWTPMHWIYKQIQRIQPEGFHHGSDGHNSKQTQSISAKPSVADLWWLSTTQWKLIGWIWWKFQAAQPHIGRPA